MKIVRNKLFTLLAVGALALGVLGIAGGVILATTATTAQAAERGDDGNGQTLAARLAEKLTGILGLAPEEAITEAQVQAAFNGVTADRQEEKLQARLEELEVEEEAATAIMDWFGDYPYSDLIRLRPMGLASSAKVEGALERLVEKERIAQEQADGIQSWYDQRPDLPEGLEKSGRHGRGGKHGHHRHGDHDHRGHDRDGDKDDGKDDSDGDGDGDSDDENA